jgi:K+/H+ antiporter YhaU regulatory subunit KhtT
VTDIEVGATRLSGVGWRYDVPLARGMTLLVVVEDGGRRHLVLAREGEDEPWLSVPLTQEQSLAVAALLSGARLSMVHREAEPPVGGGREPGTLVDSVLVTEGSAIRGVPAAVVAERLGPHAELLGVVCDQTPQILEGDPNRPLQTGDRVVVASRRTHRDEVRATLEA